MSQTTFIEQDLIDLSNISNKIIQEIKTGKHNQKQLIKYFDDLDQIIYDIKSFTIYEFSDGKCPECNNTTDIVNNSNGDHIESYCETCNEELK